MLVLNAFSLNMVATAVGHASTAAVFGQQLGTTVPTERATVALVPGDRAFVGQYRGPRLEEGVTTLPTGASIVWYLIELQDVSQETSTLYGL